MNRFGGNWTKQKIEILVEYAGAYLTIMKKYAPLYGWKLLYFDGFAGSGTIEDAKVVEPQLFETQQEPLVGATLRILEIEQPCSFDFYRFVEIDESKAEALEALVKERFRSKKFSVIPKDCNVAIKELTLRLSTEAGRKVKVLAYIDPFGMQVNWNSIELLAQHSVDAWILVPTGIGMNRLLKVDGEISDAWQDKLEKFLGMDRKAIRSYFYDEKRVATLFGDEETETVKKVRAITRSAELYQSRLGSVFKHVSKPFVLKTASNVILFHFFMCSNNGTAKKVADYIIRKYNKM